MTEDEIKEVIRERLGIPKQEPKTNRVIVWIVYIILRLLFCFVYMWLWNETISQIFQVRDITYWEMVMIFILFQSLTSKVNLPK
jgi:uncharacterized membrane protein